MSRKNIGAQWKLFTIKKLLLVTFHQPSLFRKNTPAEGRKCINISGHFFLFLRQWQTPPLPHVQLVIMVRPFKTQQRVSDECSVSLIELRPINSNSLAVAFFTLLPRTAFFFALQGYTTPVCPCVKIYMELWKGTASVWGEYAQAASATTPEAWFFWSKAKRRANPRLSVLSSKRVKRTEIELWTRSDGHLNEIINFLEAFLRDCDDLQSRHEGRFCVAVQRRREEASSPGSAAASGELQQAADAVQHRGYTQQAVREEVGSQYLPAEGAGESDGHQLRQERDHHSLVAAVRAGGVGQQDVQGAGSQRYPGSRR